MRQGLLAIALVVAAFLGGAAVNGRALTWIKAYVAQSLGDSDAPDSPQVTARPAVVPDPLAKSPDARTGIASAPTDARTGIASAPRTGIAAAPAVNAGTGAASSPPDARTGTASPASPSSDARTGLAGQSDAGTGAARGAAASTDGAGKAILPRPPFTLNFLGKKAPGNPPQDSTVKQAAVNPPDPILAPPSAGPVAAKPEVGPRVEPIVPAPVPPGSHGSLDGSSGSGQDWKSLRARLRAAGVTRYTIESRPDGRALFRCTIPVEGLSAVSQQFEAEGDDEFLAADAALRRVQLWRAAEEP